MSFTQTTASNLAGPVTSCGKSAFQPNHRPNKEELEACLHNASIRALTRKLRESLGHGTIPEPVFELEFPSSPSTTTSTTSSTIPDTLSTLPVPTVSAADKEPAWLNIVGAPSPSMLPIPTFTPRVPFVPLTAPSPSMLPMPQWSPAAPFLPASAPSPSLLPMPTFDTTSIVGTDGKNPILTPNHSRSGSFCRTPRRSPAHTRPCAPVAAPSPSRLPLPTFTPALEPTRPRPPMATRRSRLAPHLRAGSGDCTDPILSPTHTWSGTFRRTPGAPASRTESYFQLPEEEASPAFEPQPAVLHGLGFHIEEEGTGVARFFPALY
ncbi:hypothetical protein C8Q80DRAFT_1269245 [Daedaleopsis nitida]|nr:hypothetical protein C8Q80DRAFT_1269245 [Daedaleopsis nitida]